MYVTYLSDGNLLTLLLVCYFRSPQIHDDQDGLSSYDQFLKQDFPSLVYSELESYLRQESATLEEKTKAKLFDIIRDCQARLFHHYAKVGILGSKQDGNTVEGLALRNTDLDAYKPLDPLPDNFFACLSQGLIDGLNVEDRMFSNTNCQPNNTAEASDSGYCTLPRLLVSDD